MLVKIMLWTILSAGEHPDAASFSAAHRVSAMCAEQHATSCVVKKKTVKCNDKGEDKDCDGWELWGILK